MKKSSSTRKEKEDIDGEAPVFAGWNKLVGKTDISGCKNL